MSRLKVLFITDWYPSKKNPVAGVFVKEHAKAASLYNEIVVLYGEGTDGPLKGFYEIEEDIEDGLRTLRLCYRRSPIPKTSFFIYLWSIFAVFRRLVQEGWRPDVIHAHVYSAGVPAVLIGKKYKIPVVITEHSTAFPRGLIQGLEKMKAKFAFKHAHLVCPVSKDLKRNIESNGIRARFHVISNTVNTSLFVSEINTFTRWDNKKHLLLVALLNPKKGIPYLLEALSNLKEKRDDFILDIIGDGPNRSDYEALSVKFGLQNIVRFHGLKTKEEVAEFMKRCTFFVLPSLFETFGVVLIEALACGKPLLATDIGGPNEIVNNEVGRLVPPGNPKALAEAIDYMLDHYQEYDPEKITRYAHECYSYETIGTNLKKIYESVLRRY